MNTLSDVVRESAVDCYLNGWLHHTAVEDWILEAAVERLEQKLHVIKGEQARRDALPEGLRE